MRRRRSSTARALGIATASLAVLVACGPEVDPYCSEYDDVTGRGVALCRADTEQPVCDEPGDTARFERDSGGLVRLVGGVAAVCDEARQVVCRDPMVTPYCLPELDD